MKRIKLVYMLLVLFIMNCLIFNVYAKEELPQQLDKMARIVQITNDLGIITESMAKDLNSDTVVTRRDFAICVANICNFKSKSILEPSKQIFNDVRQWDNASGAIQYVYELGIINGSGDGLFRPDDGITLPEVCKIILTLAGYKDIMQINGNYPENCIVQASKVGLLKDIKSDHFTQLNTTDVIQLIYNSLNIKVMNTSSITEDSISKIEEVGTLSEELMSVYKKTGIITATEHISKLAGDGVGLGYIEIDRVRFETNKKDYESYIGCLVDFWYYDDTSGDDKVFSITLNNRCKILKIDSEDIVGYSEKVYSYNVNDTIKSVNLTPSVNVIYNGRALYSMDPQYLIPSYGNITLIDNNGDGKYDIVKVSSIELITVESVDLNSKKIYGKKNECIDLSDVGNLYIYDKDGSEKNLADIRQWNVLSVQRSLGSLDTYVSIDLSSATVQGILDEIENSSDLSKRTLSIAGEKYKVAENLYNPNGLNIIGINVKCYLDVNGRIAAIYLTNDGAGQWRLGYVMEFGKKLGVSTTYSIKLIDQDGKVYIKKCDDKIILDGEKADAFQLCNLLELDNATIRQLIRYKENNNLIKYVDTALNEELKVTNTDVGNTSNSLFMRSPALSSGTYKVSGRTFSGIFIADAVPIVFSVPAKTVTDVVDEDFVTTDLSFFKNDRSYSVEGYNISKEQIAANAIVYYRPTLTATTLDFDERIVVIDSVSSVLNRAGEQSMMIKGLSLGKNISIVANTSSLFVGLSKGDVIRLAKDSYGEAIKIENIYINGVFIPNNPSDSSYTAAVRFAYGTVLNKNGEYMYFKVNSVAEKYEAYHALRFNFVYVYDKTKIGSEKVYIGTIDDIIDSTKGTPTNILVITRAGEPRDLVVIKE